MRMDTAASIAKKLVLPAAMLLFFYAGYSLALHKPSKNSSLKIEAVPKDTVITVDGNPARTGNVAVTPGTHTVEAFRGGFEDQSQTINTQINNTTYVGFVMEPDSEETVGWYKQYPADNKLAEAISSRQYDQQTSTAVEQNSLLQQLPVRYGDGHGGLIVIASGVPIKSSGPPAVYIHGSLPADRQSALQWIRSNGFNPATMDIVFPEALGDYLGGD